MSDTYGKSVTLTIFGESHGPAVGATVTGLAPGVPVDMEFMRGQMEKRRAKGKISTSRTEADAVRVLSGVYRGAATGTALTLVIENTNTRSGDYTKTEELLRPGHADYTAHMKYGGHQDARGGGHFSGRLTAPVVAAGSIFTKLLQTKGVAIATHLAQCAGIDDAPFSGDPARLKEQLDALNAADFAVLDPLRARALYATWENMMDLLGQMEQLLGGDEVTAAEYAELFALLLHEADLGHVPETQDAVIVTTADRMRLDSPDVCFVLGVSEGKFPKLLGASGLLSHADRDLLVQGGVEMPGSYENRTLLEQMFFYRALTAPAQALYVSFVPPEAGGAPLSAAMEPLVEALAPPADVLDEAQRAPTPAAALDLLGAAYREDTPQTAALEAALRRQDTMAESLAAMERAARPAHFFARETRPLGALLGDRLTLSPTRVEQYYRCRFSYFLQYVLRIRPRRRAELSPLESGSLVHYILEHVMRRAGAEFPRLAPEELARLAGEVADQYVAENMPAAGRRFAYLVERLKRGVTRLLAYLQAEQAQSLFHPAAFEQEIGTGEGAVPPLTLRTPDGRTVQVQGKIDRVDVMEREGRTYLRVVDYKTGNKAFNLDEVYCGLNTQMLLYLFTLRSNAAQVYKNPVAAGVLYLAGDPVLKTGSRAEAAAAPVYKVDGLVLNDELVVRGMDRDATGMFVPFAFGKDGAPRASAKLASLEKLGNIEKHLDALVVEMARGLYAGEIDAVPLRTAAHCPCDVCDYRPVCLHEDGRGETSVQAPKDVFETRADACKAQGEGNI